MRSRTALGISSVIVVVVLVAALLQRSASSLPATPAPAPVAATATPPAHTGYTMADVAAHASAQSCWSAINGKVYNLTNWINQHPGGPDAILSICGIDGSDAFNAQHGGDRRAQGELSSFYIGNLSS